jgi:hypothetical protein
VGETPDRRDPPAKELECGDSRECLPSVFVIFVVRWKSVDCDLVIDPDKQCSSWYCDGEKGGDSFLHSIKLGIIHFSPITEMTSSFVQSVSAVGYPPPTANSPTVEFEAICVNDYCMVRMCL